MAMKLFMTILAHIDAETRITGTTVEIEPGAYNSGAIIAIADRLEFVAKKLRCGPVEFDNWRNSEITH